MNTSRLRSWAVLGAAAAVVGAAVVVPFLLTTGDDEKVSAPPTADRHQTGRLALGDLLSGAAPATGYLDGFTFHDGDRTTELVIPGSKRNPTAMAVIGNRILVASHGDRGTGDRMDLLEAGDVVESWTYFRGNLPPIVLTPTHTAAAFLGGDQGAVAVPEDGTPIPLRAPVDVDGLGQELGGMTGTRCTGAGADCAVLVQGYRYGDSSLAASVTYRARPGKSADVVALGVREVNAASSRGWFGGVTEIIEGGDGACSGVVDETARLLWKNCKDRMVAFSADGSKVLATTSAFFGSGEHLLAVLDARTGRDLLRIRTAKNTGIFHMVWEDDEHVLAALGTWTEDEMGEHTDQRWGVVRIGLDGTREYAVPPVDRTDPEDFDGPFVLPLG